MLIIYVLSMTNVTSPRVVVSFCQTTRMRRLHLVRFIYEMLLGMQVTKKQGKVEKGIDKKENIV